ncbi:hypothetical protein WJX74_006653 [Apatococcus lobatus]|uniref:Vacuolar ATPase assembly protein VMA22 n=1 Tax=Apatococcus lobatus TaxID=904363 RepID=A0AAW1S617_9CHLO
MASQAKEDVFLHILSLLDQYISLQNDMKTYLKAGYFGLAQARYSLGASKVGPAQYDMNMKAGRQVDVHMGEPLPRLTLKQSTMCPSVASRTVCLQSHDQPSEASDFDSQYEAGSSAVKPAKPAAYTGSSLAQEFAEKFGLADEAPLDNEPAESRSPINWFGMMVPHSLKSCQASFEAALEIAVKLAELQLHMLTLQQGSSANGMSDSYTASKLST